MGTTVEDLVIMHRLMILGFDHWEKMRDSDLDTCVTTLVADFVVCGLDVAGRIDTKYC